MTHMAIVQRWLREKMAVTPVLRVSSHDIEQGIPSYAQNFYGKKMNASTASRRWRDLKGSHSLMSEAGISTIKEIAGGTEGTWEITRQNI